MLFLKSLFFLLVSFTSAVMASENRQHSSHEHGVGQLDVAQESSEFQIALTSPAVNIFGFEHAPHDQEDHKMVEKKLAELEKGEALFVFPEGANCRLKDVHVATSWADHENTKTESTEHKQAEREHRAEHEHEHKEHDEDEHEDHEEDEQTHADVTASWHFACAHPQTVDRIHVKLFERFPQTEHLRVQWTTQNKQGAVELSSTHSVLRF